MGRKLSRRRKIIREHKTRQDERLDEILLGLDDGTSDAALNEVLNFDKFDELWDDEAREADAISRLRESSESGAAKSQRRFRERNSMWHIRYNSGR